MRRRDELGLVALGLALEQHDALALAGLGVQRFGRRSVFFAMTALAARRMCPVER